MANLQIRDMDEGLYAELKRVAAEEHRSVSQQTVHLITEHLRRRREAKPASSAEALLAFAGSWEDDRDADEIIAEVRAGRRNARPKDW